MGRLCSAATAASRSASDGVAGHVGRGGEDHLVARGADARLDLDRAHRRRGRRLRALGAPPATGPVTSRGGLPVRRRQASSPSQATVRPAVATACIRRVGVGRPRAVATCSCSWSRSLFSSRPRPAVELDPGGGQDGPGGLDGQRCRRSRPAPGRRRIMASRAAMSRSPPWDSFRSGSSRKPDVAVGGVALGDLLGQDAEPGRLLAGPALPGPLEHRLGDLRARRRSPGRRAGRGRPAGPRPPCRGPPRACGRCGRGRCPRPTPGTRCGRRRRRRPCGPCGGGRRRGR